MVEVRNTYWVCVRVFVCVCVWVCVCLCACICVCVCVFVYLCLYLCKFECLCVCEGSFCKSRYFLLSQIDFCIASCILVSQLTVSWLTRQHVWIICLALKSSKTSKQTSSVMKDPELVAWDRDANANRRLHLPDRSGFESCGVCSWSWSWTTLGCQWASAAKWLHCWSLKVCHGMPAASTARHDAAEHCAK